MDNSLEKLVRELSRLPNIGNKTAIRIAYHLLKSNDKKVEALSEAIINIKRKILYCGLCFSITDKNPCSICSDPLRNQNVICVVEEPFNISPIEKTGEYDGVYHVLLGSLSPQRGIGPDKLRIKDLLKRLDNIKEVILATNPNVEGEATALYLSRVLKERDILVTRLAFGIPVGGDLEYIDEVTLGRSIAGRNKFS